jgi:tetratricopeptide (TPR) repeat protein
MAVDPYAPCPCGSGKKLKFCCSDLLGEIEKVQRMLEGDQPRAALAHLEKTLAKNPGRASLLDLKASIEMSLGDLERAQQTVQQHLDSDPKNPSAHAQAAILAASVEPQASATGTDEAAGATPASRQAVMHLQDAMELVTDSIPARVLQAIGAVGQALLADGDLIAARAHLWLYQGVAGDQDTRAMELLMRLNRVPELPLLLRDNLFLREAPAGHAAEAEHDEAQLLASRGQWRRAAALLENLSMKYPDLSALPYNAAVVAGWLGDQPRFIAGLRKFAQLVTEQSPSQLPDDAIEAEAIAQLLDAQNREESSEVVRLAYAVADEEALIDKLTRDKRTAAYRLSESEIHALEGLPPRHTFLLLDRELPETGLGITAEATPRIVGVLSYYGRQTDKAERLVLVADRDEDFDETLRALSAVAGDALGEKAGEEVVGRGSGTPAMRSRWRFPDDTPVADRRRVVAQEQRRVLMEDWPAKPLAKLGGKSPLEAAGDPAMRLPVTAALMVLEQTAAAAVEPGVFVELRSKLGLPAPDPIDPKQVDLETIPLSRVGRVDVRKASDDDIYSLYKRTELAGATDVAKVVAREAVDRPGLAEDLPPEDLYGRLAALEPELDDALAWIERGRQSAEATGKSNAGWDLAELELRVVEGQFEEANRIVHHLRDEHLKEQGIAERLYELLYALGAVPSQEEMARMQGAGAGPEPAMSGAGSGGSKLWTPGSDEPKSGGGSKIWTPS